MAITRTVRLENNEITTAIIKFLADSGIPAKGSVKIKLPNSLDIEDGLIYIDVIETVKP
jgi:hypothetical protein